LATTFKVSDVSDRTRHCRAATTATTSRCGNVPTLSQPWCPPLAQKHAKARRMLPDGFGLGARAGGWCHGDGGQWRSTRTPTISRYSATVVRLAFVRRGCAGFCLRSLPVERSIDWLRQPEAHAAGPLGISSEAGAEQHISGYLCEMTDVRAEPLMYGGGKGKFEILRLTHPEERRVE
jgi:hypothetical protein